MPQLLTLSRAARPAGVSRGQMQVRAQGIETLEGKITVEDLPRLYPALDIDCDPILERVRACQSEHQAKVALHRSLDART